MSEKTLGQVAYEARYFGLFSMLIDSTKAEYEKMAQAVKVEVERRRWRPIETAPKDRKIQLFIPTLNGGQQIQLGRYNDDRYGSKPRPYWDYRCMNGLRFQRENQPTHWAELPSGPEATNEPA